MGHTVSNYARNRVNKLQDDEDDIKLGDSKSSYTPEFPT